MPNPLLANTIESTGDNNGEINTPQDTSLPPGTLVKPAHGQGFLRRGNPGNKGGPGPGPQALRKALRGSLAHRLPVLRAIADGKGVNVRPTDQIAALNLMARYGIGTESQLTVVSPDVQGRLQATLQLVVSRPTWDSGELMDALEAVWK